MNHPSKKLFVSFMALSCSNRIFPPLFPINSKISIISFFFDKAYRLLKFGKFFLSFFALNIFGYFAKKIINFFISI